MYTNLGNGFTWSPQRILQRPVPRLSGPMSSLRPFAWAKTNPLFRCSNCSCHHVIMSSHVITSSTSSTSVFSFWAFCIFYEELMKKTSIVVTCRILKRFGGFANYSIQIISWFKWVVRLSQSKEPKKCMHDSVFQNACLSHGSPLWTTPNLTFYLLLDLPKSLFALLLEIKSAFTKKKSRRAIMKKTSWQESGFWALRELKNLRATSDTESLWTCTECPQNTYRLHTAGIIFIF